MLKEKKIFALGGSYGLILPKSWIDLNSLKRDDLVKMEINDKKQLVISKEE